MILVGLFGSFSRDTICAARELAWVSWACCCGRVRLCLVESSTGIRQLSLSTGLAFSHGPLCGCKRAHSSIGNQFGGSRETLPRDNIGFQGGPQDA